jgi:hypothetical protein
MTPAGAIGPSILEAATRRLVGCADFGPRLHWWLQRGHSCERWLQFEWAYRLEQEVRPAGFAVICEHCRLDVSLVTVGGLLPFWKQQPAAGIELKWWGNLCH